MDRKRLTLILLAVLCLIPAGCGTGQKPPPEREAEYLSAVTAGDCRLCGDGTEKQVPPCCGQDNIALISLNTFEIKPVGINRYDTDGRLIEEYAGVVSFGGGGSTDGGFSASIILNHDRGFAAGSVDFLGDETLDTDKAASFLCAECLDKILPEEPGQCFGVGAINLGTGEIRLFEKNLCGFGLGDFYIDCDLKEQPNGGSRQMDLLIFYCPMRYGQRP